MDQGFPTFFNIEINEESNHFDVLLELCFSVFHVQDPRSIVDESDFHFSVDLFSTVPGLLDYEVVDLDVVRALRHAFTLYCDTVDGEYCVNFCRPILEALIACMLARLAQTYN